MRGVSESIAAGAALPECLEEALRSLKGALEKLAAAAERHARAESLRANHEEELAIMQDDRARLGVEFDGAAARVKALELANDEVQRRLDHAGAEIRAILAGLEAGDGG